MTRHRPYSLHFAHYNLVRLHKTLRVTLAMAANVTNRVWSLEELVDRTSKYGVSCEPVFGLEF